MPHLVHLPGLLLVTSECMGQEYIFITSIFIFSFGESVNEVPHFEHLPGLSLVMSGWLEHEYV